MSLVLYFAPNSSAYTAYWALEELGIPYEKAKIDLPRGDQKKPEFVALNPNAKVPLLVHEGTPIFESAAIVAYLGETFGVERGLFPAPGPKRGEALKWLVWTNASLAATIGELYYHTSDRTPADEHHAKSAARHRAEAESLFGILEDALKKNKYLLGDAFSLVDAHVAGFAFWASLVGMDTKKWPAVDAWLRTCTGRPATSRIPSS